MSPSLTRKPAASSKSLPGVRIVTATLTGSWCLPLTWIAIGSSVARRSGRSRPMPPASAASTRIGVVERRTAGRGAGDAACGCADCREAPPASSDMGRSLTITICSSRCPRPSRAHASQSAAAATSARHPSRVACHSTADSNGWWCRVATIAIATIATRPQPTWTMVSGCPRMTSAATAAMMGLLDPITDETEAST